MGQMSLARRHRKAYFSVFRCVCVSVCLCVSVCVCDTTSVSVTIMLYETQLWKQGATSPSPMSLWH